MFLYLLLFGVIICLMTIISKRNKKITSLIDELLNNSLEYYLKQIHKKGYDVSIKPKKEK